MAGALCISDWYCLIFRRYGCTKGGGYKEAELGLGKRSVWAAGEGSETCITYHTVLDQSGPGLSNSKQDVIDDERPV